MANCSNLERLNFAGNDTITELGLRALSSLLQTKEFLRSVDLRAMNCVSALIGEPQIIENAQSVRRQHWRRGLNALSAAQPD